MAFDDQRTEAMRELSRIYAKFAELSSLERLYVRIFGIPINGLRIRLRRVSKVLPQEALNILDAGCGRGIFSLYCALKYPNAKITAVDFDEELITKNSAFAQKAGIRNIQFQKADVSELTFHETFDLVLSIDNLEHIEHDQIAIEKLTAAVKPGGILIVHTPAYERRWFWMTWQHNFDVPGHFRPGYRLDELRSMIEKCGLQIIEAYPTFGYWENLSNNISYWVTGAEAKNRLIYAVFFPFLNLMSWLGKDTKPSKGAGNLIVARKID